MEFNLNKLLEETNLNKLLIWQRYHQKKQLARQAATLS